MGGPPLDAEERIVVRLLASGRLGEAAARLSRADRRDLVGLVGVTDARARALEVDVPEVEAVVERVEAEEPADSRLRFWVYAVLAERLLLELDGTAFAVAEQTLDELTGEALPARLPLTMRYARARLNRIVSMAWLLAPTPEGLAARRSRRDQAVSEFLACNLVDEVHVSRGLAAGLAVAVAEDDILENYARLRDARAAVDDDVASMWPALLDVFVGIVAFEAGDLTAALEAYDRLDRQPRIHTRVAGLVRFGRAFFRIITRGASPQALADLERALTDVRRHDPRIAQAWHGQLAQTLTDMGSPAAAHFARLEAELPPVGPVHAVGRELLGYRIAALGGSAVAAQTAVAALERLEAAGYVRRSGRQALRLAHDLARAGHAGEARPLHAWGLPRLPPAPRLTMWERWWSRPLEGDSPWNYVPFAPVGPPALHWAGGRVDEEPAAGALAGAGGSGEQGGRGGTAGPGESAAGSATARGRRRDPTWGRGGEGAGTQPRDRIALHVLAPALELEIGDELRPVRATVAKLLIALVIAHPRPLHVEQVAELLWPGTSLGSVRRRLNTVVHRARRLVPAHPPAVRRAGDLVSLDATGVDVDLLDFRRDLDADPDEQLAALLGVRGNLCQAQFPYDEQFLEERHRFIGTWLGEARALIAAGKVDPARLTAAATALGLDPRDIDP